MTYNIKPLIWETNLSGDQRAKTRFASFEITAEGAVFKLTFEDAYDVHHWVFPTSDDAKAFAWSFWVARLDQDLQAAA